MNDEKEGEEVEQIELEIDGILFEKHPYLDKDFGKQTIHFFTLMCHSY